MTLQTAEEWLHQCELANQEDEKSSAYMVTKKQAHARDAAVRLDERRKTLEEVADAISKVDTHDDQLLPRDASIKIIAELEPQEAPNAPRMTEDDTVEQWKGFVSKRTSTHVKALACSIEGGIIIGKYGHRIPVSVGDWIVKHEDGSLSARSNEAFMEEFEPSGPCDAYPQ